MTRSVLSIVAIVTIILTTAPPGYAGDPSFQGLGLMPGGFTSSASGISADGTVVVGAGVTASGLEAIRWTSGGGIVGLGDLPGGSILSLAKGTSADGSVVVGQGTSASSWPNGEAFLWTSGGMVGLGDLPGGVFSSSANGISADGAAVVGRGSSAYGTEAFRWTSGGGMIGLGDLPGGAFLSNASAMSADGAAVVGLGSSASGTEAFRWTSGGGMVGLGDLPGGSFMSRAWATSADGAVVVGQSVSASSSPFGEAFLWTSGGMVGLGDLPGGFFASVAYGVSADGAVVVGRGFTAFAPDGAEAFLWTADDGMRSLRDVLVTDLGLDLTGWQLQEAKGVSADGMTIVGNGTNPDGFTEGWIATLPGPATLSLDIKPGSCPNPLNRRSRGVLPVAVVGTEDFDATQIDVSSVVLSRADGVGGAVAPNEGPPGPHSVFEDVATPFEGEACDCDDASGDGMMDLSLKFRTDDVVEILQLDDLEFGGEVELVVTGTLLDGTEFSTAGDCILIVPQGTSNANVDSNVADLFVELSPADLNVDDSGFADFQRIYHPGTVITLTAPPQAEGLVFHAWLVDGVMQNAGETTIDVTVVVDLTARAVYLSAMPRPTLGPSLAPTSRRAAPTGQRR
jgi:probable HAF family extracellular repeat protein